MAATNVITSPARLTESFAEYVELESAEGSQLQLLNEQITSVAREISGLRQDVNTLRLADSQYEVQSAETARHVRDMRAQIQTDMHGEAARSDEVTRRLEASIASASAEVQRSSRGLGQLADKVARDMRQMDERVSEFSNAKGDLASRRTTQVKAEDEKARLDKVANLQSDLALEVRSMKSDFDGQVREMHASLRQAIGNLNDELGVELQKLKERDDALNASVQYLEERTKSNLAVAQDRLEDQLEQVSIESSTRHADLKELVLRTATIESSARSDLQGELKVEIQELQTKTRSHMNDALAECKSNADRTYSNFKDVIAKESAARQKAQGAFGERLVDAERRIRDSAAELNESRNKAATSAMLDTLEQKLLDEHARATDAHGSKHDQFKGSLASMVATIENLERKVDFRAKTVITSEAPSSTPVEGMLSSLERKLREELLGHSSEHRSRFQELKDQLARFHSEHSMKHAETSELVARISAQDKLARDDHKGSIGQDLDALEQKLRREISGAGAGYDSFKEPLAQEVINRERALSILLERLEEVDRRARDSKDSEFRKLHDDLVEEHSARQAELKETFMRVSLEFNTRHSEHKDEVAKMILQEKAAREEIRAAVALSADNMCTMLRRELEESQVSLDSNAAALREELSKDRVEREGQYSSVASSLSTVERRCREEVLSRADEQRSAMSELKDDVAKAIGSQVSARDDLRLGVTYSIEALEVKLRREMADDSVIREFLSLERQVWEKAMGAVSERLSDIERKLVADLAQVSIKREVAMTELRELVAETCSSERSCLQELLIKEAEARALLQDTVQKQLSQERAAREVQQETLRVYLAHDKGQRETPMQVLRERIDVLERARVVAMKDYLSRVEFDNSQRRVWEIVDSLSYSLALRNDKAAGVEVQKVVPTVQVPSLTAGGKTMLYMLPPSAAIISPLITESALVDSTSAAARAADVRDARFAMGTSPMRGPRRNA